MTRNKKITIAGGIIAVLFAVGAVIYFQGKETSEVSTTLPEEIQEKSIEEQKTALRTELQEKEAEIYKEMAEQGCSGMEMEGICWELQLKRILLQEEYQKKIDLLTARPPEEREAATQAIREFRGKPDLELEYISTRSSPTQFGIGKIIKQGEGMMAYDTPDELKIPVEVYQEKELIGDGCEVYEYEVDTETNKVIEMRIVYPTKRYEMEAKMPREEFMQRCQKGWEFLEYPLLTQTKLEEIAMNFLKMNIKNFEEIKDEFVYQPSTTNPKKIASQHTWRWVGEKPELPEGWMVEMPPVIQLMISCGGHIINYQNTVDSFRVIDKIKP